MKRLAKRVGDSSAPSPSYHSPRPKLPALPSHGGSYCWRRYALLVVLSGLAVIMCGFLAVRRPEEEEWRKGADSPRPADPAPFASVIPDAGRMGRRSVASIGRATSLAQVREFCHRSAPELEAASWVKNGVDADTARSPYGSVLYHIEAAPVCIDHRGEVYVDPIHFRGNESALAPHVSYSISNLTDAIFQRGGPEDYAEVVPAIALLVRVRWVDSHIWHLMRDCAGALMMFFQRYNNAEMFMLPTQTVLLRTATGNWVDRYGDTKKKIALSAKVLNSFSSPLHNGSFYNTTPDYTVRQRNSPPTASLSSAAASEPLPQPSMQCFCQGMEVHKRVMIRNVGAEVFYGLQETIVNEFGEDDYLTGYSFEETDRRRRASHPWATEFWNESTFDANGTYRPRALVIHRKSRLIGDIDKYVGHLRTLGFRVEEIFPERLTIEQQYHLGRYADLLVGMHGLGLAHGFWMDRFPIGCRSIVEFRPWVYIHQPRDLYRIMGRHSRFHYYFPVPTDVTFGDSVANKMGARVRLMDERNGASAWSFPEFTDQVAYYDETDVLRNLDSVKRHLDACLPQSETVSRGSLVVRPKKKKRGR